MLQAANPQQEEQNSVLLKTQEVPGRGSCAYASPQSTSTPWPSNLQSVLFLVSLPCILQSRSISIPSVCCPSLNSFMCKWGEILTQGANGAGGPGVDPCSCKTHRTALIGWDRWCGTKRPAAAPQFLARSLQLWTHSSGPTRQPSNLHACGSSRPQTTSNSTPFASHHHPDCRAQPCIANTPSPSKSKSPSPPATVDICARPLSTARL